MPLITLAITLLIIYGLGDVLSKEYNLRQSWTWMLGALACYTCGTMLWIYSIGKGLSISKGAMLFTMVSLITSMIIGCGIYKEPLTLHQIIGVVLGFCAVVLLNY